MTSVKNQKNYMDEETDMMYAPSRATNSRKSNAPVFIRELLITYSNPDKPLRQSQIQELLSEKFGLEMERKSIGRHLHNLAGEELGIVCGPSGECWYDPRENIWEFCA